MRRPCADREEKHVTRGNDRSGPEREQEQLDLKDPNQRRHLALLTPSCGGPAPTAKRST
jgi:hypothetical protein